MTGKTFYTSDVAVALKYDGERAPKVTAKGTGVSAEKILEIAEQHGIPLQSNPELSKILAEVPLGEEIPQNLYVAVAEVISFAYFLRGKTPDDNEE